MCHALSIKSCKAKGNSIPIQAWAHTECSRTLRSQISRQWAHESGKVVSPTDWPPLPQKIFPILISVRGLVISRIIELPEGLCQLHFREWNPRTSDLWRSASNNCATEYESNRVLSQNLHLRVSYNCHSTQPLFPQTIPIGLVCAADSWV